MSYFTIWPCDRGQTNSGWLSCRPHVPFITCTHGRAACGKELFLWTCKIVGGDIIYIYIYIYIILPPTIMDCYIYIYIYIHTYIYIWRNLKRSAPSNKWNQHITYVACYLGYTRIKWLTTRDMIYDIRHFRFGEGDVTIMRLSAVSDANEFI